MKFLHYDLGDLDAGSVVVVGLSGTEANVLLLDDANVGRYRRRDRYRYCGGHFTRSPARIPVPSGGSWHLIIDLGAYAGHVDASVHVVAA